MLKLVFFVAVVAVGGYFFPQVYEKTGTPCQALERKALRVNTDSSSASSRIASLTLSLTNGGLGRKMASDRYPNLPAPLDCVATYYNFPADWQR